ncbi:hybrid sensor histidine kinase/response regulator [Aquabacterium sp.]|uniref:hybrid sensor histidine kinase/response regulator n=1 Tax=Aquabacterium sp. TaxID=1872578 RepID=UPI002C27C928|nr:response regulator [Aquabacterium sp.]HSW08803.1 response regulator [Aquabacterium sp.]
MARDPYRYFRIEARELLEQLGRGVLDLEKGADMAPQGPPLVPRLLRLTHTLKGAARVVRQGDIADQAHAIEDLLAPLRDAAPGPQREPIDAMLARLDRIGALLAELGPAAAPDATADAGAGAPVADAAPPPLLRPELSELDALLEGVAQTHAQLAALRRQVLPLQEARALAEQLDAHPTPAARVPAERLRALLERLERGLAAPLEQMDRELRQVRDAAEQLRLVPAAALFAPLERLVRDTAKAQGKSAALHHRGAAVRLDATVLAALQAPLLQLVRNAVVHGIESEGQRVALGKPAAGRVTLAVERQGRRVVFRCSDDGAGVDLDAVRRAAQRKGWLGTATQEHDGPALLQLLLRGGLSTAASVTEAAGRGVGLDVVREALERLGGEVSVRSSTGQGTEISLAVPLSLASLEALVVDADGASAAIPLDAVHRTVRLETQHIARSAQGDSIVHEGEVLPFVSLSRLLGRSTPNRGARFASAVIVAGAGGRAAIGVDRLLGAASVVLRALPALALSTAVVAGASLDVDGQPQLVLDPDGLVSAATSAASSAGAAEAQAAAPRAPVLVIDDSLTTRMLEQSILESAGYAVHTAASAEQGLVQARRQRYALFLVDVEMPGMDGFGFIETVRADPALREVPAMLVTSRGSAEDRRRGQQAGAQGYIVKGEFAQDDFLRRVRQLVGGA